MIGNEKLPSRLGAWELCDQIFRSVFIAFWRLPALALLSLLLYAIVSAYGSRILPFADAHNWQQRLINESFYDCLHGLIFGPLVMAVMQLILCGRFRKENLWSRSLLYIMGFLAVRDFVDAFLAVPVESLNHAIAMPLYNWLGAGMIFSSVFMVTACLWYAVCFFIWVRLILVWPAFALSHADGKAVLTQSWEYMRGKYPLALWVSFLAVLPYFFLEEFIYTHIYRQLASIGMPVSDALTPAKIEGLLVRSASLMVRYTLYASLAAWLYRAIVTDRAKPTALSL